MPRPATIGRTETLWQAGHRAAWRRTAWLRTGWLQATGMILIASGVGPAMARGASEQAAESQGELRLTGRFIKTLVLEREGHGRITLEAPKSVVPLKEGNYRWQEICLEAEHGTKFKTTALQGPWFCITHDEPTTLDIGGPLEPLVQTRIQGNKLMLDHYLRGREGEHYLPVNHVSQPSYTVTHGGRPVGSAKIEYG